MDYQKITFNALAGYFEMEIKNKVEASKNQMVVFLSDGTKALVKVKKTYNQNISSKDVFITQNNAYVQFHNFGYGSEPEKRELNKLTLRNIDDLKCYVLELMEISFIAKVDKNVISFFDSKQKIVVDIKKID